MGDDPLFDDDDHPDIPPPTGPWRPRFGIGAMMLVVFVCAAMSAMGNYMLNDVEGGLFGSRFSFIFVTLAAPILLMTLLSVGREIMHQYDKHVRENSRRDD